MRASVERAGAEARFVIAGADEPLHGAIRDLAYQDESGAFVKTFPLDAAHLDDAASGFVEHIEEIVLQAARLRPAAWQDALERAAERLAGVDWWLAGSGALAARGLDVSPRDLDLVVSEDDAPRVADALADALDEPLTESPGWIARWWGRSFLGARVEWIGGASAQADQPEPSDFGPTAAARLDTITWRGRELRVPPLDLQLAVTERRGLPGRAAAIRALLA